MNPIPTTKQLNIELNNLFNRTFPKYTDQIQLKNIELVRIQLLGFSTVNNPRIVFYTKKTYQDKNQPSSIIYRDIIFLEEYRGQYKQFDYEFQQLLNRINGATSLSEIVPDFDLPIDATLTDKLLFIFR